MQRVILERDLPGAAQRGELVAYYQPQLEVASGRVIGAEALVRWQHPELGLVPPLDFISIAEETGTIHEVGDFMIEEGCAFAASLEADEIEIAVNVSAVQLDDPAFSSRVKDAYLRHGLKPEHLTIELTESRPVLDVPAAIAQLDSLRSLGIGISIDDFGSGYSSLKQLDALPFTELKIDQELIGNVATSPRSRMIVASTIQLAHALELRIVAEGVENAADLTELVAMGIDTVQGYHLARPMTGDELNRWILGRTLTTLDPDDDKEESR